MGDWDGAAQLLATDARHLQNAGAELIVLCTNTMHLVAPAIEAAIDVPFLHLADATALAVTDAGLSTVALLGTRYTMEHDFYRGRLVAHGLEVLVPDEPDRTRVHDVIYDELVQGTIVDASRRTTWPSSTACSHGAPRVSSRAAPRSSCWSGAMTVKLSLLPPPPTCTR